jgi:hypothetical protein
MALATTDRWLRMPQPRSQPTRSPAHPSVTPRQLARTIYPIQLAGSLYHMGRLATSPQPDRRWQFPISPGGMA